MFIGTIVVLNVNSTNWFFCVACQEVAIAESVAKRISRKVRKCSHHSIALCTTWSSVHHWILPTVLLM